MNTNKEIMCWYDEAFTIDEIWEETNYCIKCQHKECPNYKKARERNYE